MVRPASDPAREASLQLHLLATHEPVRGETLPGEGGKSRLHASLGQTMISQGLAPLVAPVPLCSTPDISCLGLPFQTMVTLGALDLSSRVHDGFLVLTQ